MVATIPKTHVLGGPVFGHSPVFSLYIKFQKLSLKTANSLCVVFGSSSSHATGVWFISLAHFNGLGHPWWWTRRILARISQSLLWTYSDRDLIKKLTMSMQTSSSCAMQMQDESCFAREGLISWEKILQQSPAGSFAFHQITRLSTMNLAACCLVPAAASPEWSPCTAWTLGKRPVQWPRGLAIRPRCRRFRKPRLCTHHLIMKKPRQTICPGQLMPLSSSSTRTCVWRVLSCIHC